MVRVMNCLHGIVWGVPALLMIVGVGIWLTIRTGFAQIRLFPESIRLFLRQMRETPKGNGTSPYQALCTALAATVGTGNLAGVAGAIALGGPGAVFWMWVSAILGMIIKYAEASLGVRFRKKNRNGEWLGGPMYLGTLGIGSRCKWLAGIYCFLGVIAAFGVGNATQVNAAVSGIRTVFSVFDFKASFRADILVGVVFAVLIAVMLLNGAARIGRIAEGLVPVGAAFYLLICFGVLFVRIRYVPDAFFQIIRGAWSPASVTGGALGSAYIALRVGVSRGVFTNEAGMGTASIAHSSANAKHPVEQGMLGIVEVFIDTIVICTMTALVILCSGVDIPFGFDVGALLTVDAFSKVYGTWVVIPIALSLCLFALATVLGWGLYGARCAQFLFGDSAWKVFAVIQAVIAVVGSVMRTETVWMITEIINGLMVIPNLIFLAYLSPELVRLTKEYR